MMSKTDAIVHITKGNISWSLEDVQNILLDNGVEPTNENVEKFLSGGFFNRMGDTLCQEGNDMLARHYEEVFKHEKEEVKS